MVRNAIDSVQHFWCKFKKWGENGQKKMVEKWIFNGFHFDKGLEYEDL